MIVAERMADNRVARAAKLLDLLFQADHVAIARDFAPKARTTRLAFERCQLGARRPAANTANTAIAAPISGCTIVAPTADRQKNRKQASKAKSYYGQTPVTPITGFVVERATSSPSLVQHPCDTLPYLPWTP